MKEGLHSDYRLRNRGAVRSRLLQQLALLFATLPLFSSAWAFQPVAARHGMVVAAEPLAAEVGVQILKQGGNAVDAAVAVGFALAVTNPQAGNIGGGGFMLIRMASGECVVIDYREEAPGKATHDMYLDSGGNLIPHATLLGGLASGVPGTVAGLALAERKYGKLGLARVMEPAIRLASEGFPMSYSLSKLLNEYSDRLSKFQETKRIFLRDGKPYEAGEIFRQPELAQTLRLIQKKGPEGFYRGKVAKDLAASVKRHGGIISREDLREYRAKVRRPLVGHFRGYTILTVPPPSSGGVALLEMLNILGPIDLGPPNSYRSIHLIAETMRRAYADRAAYLGDTDFVSVPETGLLSKSYATKLREEILNSLPDAPISAGRPAPYESSETTHYSVVDDAGDAVSNTYTLNEWFGSAVTVEGAGFLMNDEMDDFAAKPGSPNMFGLIQGKANSIAPRKRPLSSMTPTIVLSRTAVAPPKVLGSVERSPSPRRRAASRHLQVRLVLGSPGGATIINTVLQVMLNVLVYRMDVLRAVTEPRFHDQWMPDRLEMEPGFSADTIEKLVQAGYKLKILDDVGDCETIAVDPRTHWRFGAADPRRGGKAAGY
jgi:gamma-glutamyltranspeptidase / glutathione hydrolase